MRVAAAAAVDVADLEDRAVESVRTISRLVQEREYLDAFKATGEFSNVTAALVGVWLTPSSVGLCASFFKDGTALFFHDAARRPARFDPLACYFFFLLLILNTIPLTPLIIPLIDRGIGEGKQHQYLPRGYRTARLKALARLRRARENPGSRP